ncbi:hypothetical protein BDBG_16408, partial [Blastomyces gilchristii SLH14081]
LSMQSCIHAVHAELRDCVSCKSTAVSQRESYSVKKLQLSVTCTEKSLCEICYYQKLENLIFLKIIFTCLIHEINERNHQFQHSVLDIIQVIAEFTLATLFKYDVKTMTHCSCVTLTVRNTQLMINIVKTLRSEYFKSA